MSTSRSVVRAASIGLCLLAVPLSAAAQDQAGDESSGLVGLSLPLGARVVGQGRAAAGATGELQAVPYNPAAIVGLEGGALTYSRFEAARDAEINGNYVAGAYAADWGTLALHAIYLDYGEITLTEASPVPVGTIEVSDWALGITYARRWREKLAFGGTAKWLSVDLGSTDAAGAAFDVGLVYQPRATLPLGLAVAVRNLGPDLEFSDGVEAGADTDLSEALPGRVRVGVHFAPDTFPGLPPDFTLALGFDIESVLRELATSSQHAGVALTIHDLVVLRGGLLLIDNPFSSGSTSHRNTGGSVGVGVHLGGFEADLAREISVSELGDETHIGISWHF